ncbi:MAG: AlpA family phage regulatory protein [Paucibacter sp.]|nr:AlpA family phage regulatory protein [Roseateles sp.]
MPAPRLLRLGEVLHRTGLSRTVTYERMANGLHPRAIKIGRCSLWLEHEISSWIEQLALQR